MTCRSIVFVVLALAAGPGVSAAKERAKATDTGNSTEAIINVRLSPPAFEPRDMRVFVQVKPHPDNRLLRLVIDADDYYRSTDIPLDGADAPKTHSLVWRSVPPGRYIFSATVYGPGGSRGQFIQQRSDIVPGSAEWD
jgi:hypothetical protein